MPPQGGGDPYAVQSAPRQSHIPSQSQIPPPMGVATLEEFPRTIQELQYASIPPPPPQGQTAFAATQGSSEQNLPYGKTDLRQQGMEIMQRLHDGRNLQGRSYGPSKGLPSFDDMAQPFV